MKKILITSPESRKTFDIFSILITYKYKNHIIFFSKHSCFIRFILKLIYGCKVEPLNNLVNYKNEEDYKILAIEEEDILFLNKNNLFQSQIVDSNVFNTFRDKYLLSTFLKDLNINYPKSYLLSKYNYELEFPIIVKPRVGMGSENVELLNSNKQLCDYKNCFLEHDNFIIQEYINSDSNIVSACGYVYDGKLLSYYSHIRILTFPKSRGVTVVSKSFYDCHLENLLNIIVMKTNYTGFIMIEFLKDLNGNYTLIEINPRPWGSIKLSELTQSNLISSFLNFKKMINKNLVESYIVWFFPHYFIYLIKNLNLNLKLKLFHPVTFIMFSKKMFIRSFFFNLFFILNLSRIIKKLCK